MLAATGGACYSIFLMPFLLNIQRLFSGGSSYGSYSSYTSPIIEGLYLFLNIFTWICFIGGIIVLIGVLISIKHPSQGWKVVLAGGIVGLGSVPAILASIFMIRPKEKTKKYNIASQESKHNYCYNCGRAVPYGESQCEKCKREVSSIFD